MENQFSIILGKRTTLEVGVIVQIMKRKGKKMKGRDGKWYVVKGNRWMKVASSKKKISPKMFIDDIDRKIKDLSEENFLTEDKKLKLSLLYNRCGKDCDLDELASILRYYTNDESNFQILLEIIDKIDLHELYNFIDGYVHDNEDFEILIHLIQEIGFDKAKNYFMGKLLYEKFVKNKDIRFPRIRSKYIIDMEKNNLNPDFF